MVRRNKITVQYVVDIEGAAAHSLNKGYIEAIARQFWNERGYHFGIYAIEAHDGKIYFDLGSICREDESVEATIASLDNMANSVGEKIKSIIYGMTRK